MQIRGIFKPGAHAGGPPCSSAASPVAASASQPHQPQPLSLCFTCAEKHGKYDFPGPAQRDGDRETAAGW